MNASIQPQVPQVTFALEQSQEISDYFAQYGYVVLRDLISHAQIDVFLTSYNKIKISPWFVYYSQSIHRCIRPDLTDAGYIKESMQNATRLAFFTDFVKSFKACIYSENVAVALTAVDGYEKHVSWQNMFFDKSTGTIEHQDSWYLDTSPPGALIGVWFALEDIQDNCGSFFVCPGSHKLGLIDRNDYPVHEEFVKRVQELTANSVMEKRPMYLNKGDILLWHPYLIHGAFRCLDESLSRKSFTSHYYPLGLKAKDTESTKKFSVYNHKNLKPTEKQHRRIYSAYRFNDYFYNLLVYLLFFKENLARAKAKTSMRRENYE
jgi:phytanoyl-CoA hydroxylase